MIKLSFFGQVALRMRYVNKHYGNPLQVIDYIGDTAWLGIWNDSKVDPEAMVDYLKTDACDIVIAPASSCVTFRQSILCEFSHVVRIDFKEKESDIDIPE